MDFMEEIAIWSQIDEGSKRKTVVMEGCQEKIIDSDNYFGRPVLGKIIAFPMRSITQFSYNKPWAVISITDPDYQPPRINETNCVDILRLQFDDVELPRGSMVPISSEQAEKTWDFVASVWDQIDLLAIHCHAGISRSTAFAKAISEVYQSEFADYFTQLYSPNALVYKVLMEHKS